MRRAINHAACGRLVSELRRDGYCILHGVAPAPVHALAKDLEPVFAETPFCQGDFYGRRTKRFGSLLRRSRHMADLVLDPLVLPAVEAILGTGCERIQLNLTQAIEIHPGEVRQFPHRDQDMWRGADGSQEYLVNVLWPLTPFTRDNGATEIYPGSHGVSGMAKEDPGPPIYAECEPGSAICFLGSTAHGAGANISENVRRGLLVSYSLGWLKPYENLWLAYPPHVARDFPPGLAALAGYAQHRPNLGNYEGQCPSILLQDDPPGPVGAVDALRPDQADAVADFAAGQRNAQ
ncbi:phytanoyl-CoA dioxygenase family protein [Sphingopyxis terrae]|uniref:phytanoyl-CoA dioxygenase family protein n=1 Tax=Sphingopyxis terrae TaxID=33052 RepID=UPI001C2BF9DE|nr:phytanoyl-CoA dioxygenase family protein [Sphingopyxis terrae]QXF13736.1 phytanoyl-CoA dioxygenase family protein [Sphingopyxis terrae subsp. terrae]